MPATKLNTDVLIIGAGPAGLFLSNALRRLDVNVNIIDKRSKGEAYGKADGIQPGTAEIWQSYGLLEAVLREGAQIHSLVSYDTDAASQELKRTAQMKNIQVPDARYPFEIVAPIETIEEIMRSSLVSHGTDVIQPCIPQSLSFEPVDTVLDSEYPVAVTCQHTLPSLTGNGSAETTPTIISAKYLVGCDGAHSWVRKSANIRMEGDIGPNVLWGVMDCTPISSFPDFLSKCIVKSPICGMLGWIPRPGNTGRVYIPLDPVLASKDIESIQEEVIRRVEMILKAWDLKIQDVTWFGTYRVAQKVADTYSYGGRVFIAGDACHTHSPNAGQGANASMQDSHNLAWKLAYVLRRWAKPSLLDTYDEERRAFANTLIDFDKQITDPLADTQSLSGEYEKIWQLKNRFITGLGIQYDSRLSVHQADSLVPGIIVGETIRPSHILRLADWKMTNIQDLLLSDGQFKLLLFGGDILQADVMSALTGFAGTMKEGMGHARRCTAGGRLPPVVSFTILKVQKAEFLWTELPEPLRQLDRVFVDDSINDGDFGGNTYTQYGISPQGAAVLVRPDGYVSMITEIGSKAAGVITDFLFDL